MQLHRDQSIKDCAQGEISATAYRFVQLRIMTFVTTLYLLLHPTGSKCRITFRLYTMTNTKIHNSGIQRVCNTQYEHMLRHSLKSTL